MKDGPTRLQSNLDRSLFSFCVYNFDQIEILFILLNCVVNLRGFSSDSFQIALIISNLGIRQDFAKGLVDAL